MGLFSGIGGAKVGVGGAYFSAGQYIVRLKLVKIVQSRKHEDLYTVETIVKSSNNPDIKVGELRTWQTNAKRDSFLGNVKGFLAACNGVDPSNEVQVAELFPNPEEAEAAAEFSVDEKENPLGGIWLNLSCVLKKTKAGGDFTVHNWMPYPAEGQMLHPDYVAEQATK